MRSFSLGYKKPAWSSLEVGVGKVLTNARIRHYISKGRYGDSIILRKPKSKLSNAVVKDRKARDLVSEYLSI